MEKALILCSFLLFFTLSACGNKQANKITRSYDRTTNPVENFATANPSQPDVVRDDTLIAKVTSYKRSESDRYWEGICAHDDGMGGWAEWNFRSIGEPQNGEAKFVNEVSFDGAGNQSMFLDLIYQKP